MRGFDPKNLKLASLQISNPEAESERVEITQDAARGGLALWAKLTFSPGDVLAEIRVEACDKETYSVQVAPESHVDIGPVYRFMNHSCDPNIKMDVERAEIFRVIRVVAVKAIRAGEPLSFNYNSTEYDMASPFACACGSQGCVGTVRGAKHLDTAQLRDLTSLMPLHLIETLKIGK